MYRFKISPDQRAHAWAMFAAAVFDERRPERAPIIADELLAELDKRAAAGKFDPEREGAPDYDRGL